MTSTRPGSLRRRPSRYRGSPEPVIGVVPAVEVVEEAAVTPARLGVVAQLDQDR